MVMSFLYPYPPGMRAGKCEQVVVISRTAERHNFRLLFQKELLFTVLFLVFCSISVYPLL